MPDHAQKAALSRRGLLQLVAAGSAAVGLGACTDTSDVQSQTQQSNAPLSFDIPANDKLPTDKAALRFVDSGDQKAQFWKPFFAAYSKLHSNVSVDYQGTSWNSIQQQITLGLRNGTAPDVFQLPGTITLAQAVESKWIGAWDDIVPDWQAVRDRLPAGSFANGTTDFDGKTYGSGMSSNRRINNFLLFNEKLTKASDQDFTKIISWDDFRTALKAITTKGAGNYYGIILGLTQNGALSGNIDIMTEMAGVPNGASGIDFKTGEYNFTNPIVQECVELWLAIHSDGSIFPGSTSIDWPGARGRFPQGVAAVIPQGAWNIRPWITADPSFQLNLNLPAQLDPNKMMPVGYGPGGSNSYVYAANSKSPEIIGDMWNYCMSEQGQTMWATLDGAGDPAILPSAFDKAQLGALEQRAVDFYQKNMVIMPQPAVRNPDVETVDKVMVPLQPTWAQVTLGLLTGQLTDVKKQLQSLQDRSNAALDTAIATAKKRGAKVSRDDYIFSDWDPTQPYDKLYKK